LRLVVEVTNSFLKVPNKSLPHTLVDYKKAGPLTNKFFKRLYSDQTNEKEISKNMKDKLKIENELEKLVKDNKLNLKTKFTKLDSRSINDFPKLKLTEIKIRITLSKRKFN
jgi:hypothetical protein